MVDIDITAFPSISGVIDNLTIGVENENLYSAHICKGSGHSLLSGIGQDTSEAKRFTPIGMYDTILIGGDGKDGLFAEPGNDWLRGGDRNDTLFGDNGDDMLFGGKGDDPLFGANGKDLCDGQEGKVDWASFTCELTVHVP